MGKILHAIGVYGQECSPLDNAESGTHHDWG